jgi:hypothetical protein
VVVSPLQLVNLHRNRRYFVIKLHTWFCLSYFLKTNIQFYCICKYFMSINSFSTPYLFLDTAARLQWPVTQISMFQQFFFLNNVVWSSNQIDRVTTFVLQIFRKVQLICTFPTNTKVGIHFLRFNCSSDSKNVSSGCYVI